MESVSEGTSVFSTLHEQFESYKLCLKLKKSPVDDQVMKSEDKCMELLEKMQELVNKKLENVESREAEFPRLLAMKCAIKYEKGRTLKRFGDEKLGLKTMEEALALSARHRHLPELSYLILKICNTISYQQSKLEDYDKAYITLETARAIYGLVANGNNVDFYTVNDLFSEDAVMIPKAETKILLERLMTNNFHILGFVCNKLSRIEECFKYAHEMLKRQLLDLENDPIVWARNAGDLAYELMSLNRFREARNHLAAAYNIVSKYDDQLNKEWADREHLVFTNERIKNTLADIAKLWVKYCLCLLSASKQEHILAFYTDADVVIENIWMPKNTTIIEEVPEDESITETEPSEVTSVSGAPCNIVKNEVESQQSDEESSSNLEKEEEVKNNEEECLNTKETKTDEDDCSSQCKEDKQNEIPRKRLLLFVTLPLEDLENQITANILENTEQARAVVKFAQAWLRRYKMYYNIHLYPTEYINSVLELSDLYRYLAFFEVDVENQIMAQKNRQDILELLNVTLRDLRPPCYLSQTIELLRELAEVQMELIGLNFRRQFSEKQKHDQDGSKSSTSGGLQKIILEDLNGRPEHIGEAFEFIAQPFQAFDEGGNETL